jgi:hypothetical protein
MQFCRHAVMPDISDRPWSGVTRASYPTAAEYCAACLIDQNAAGDPKTKSRCKLPVYEPPEMGGALNRHAVRAAADRLVAAQGGVQAPLADRQSAARRLLELFVAIGEAPPHSLTELAGRDAPQPPVAGSWGALDPECAM